MISKCPDCGGALEEGAILDYTYGGVAVQRHAKAVVPKKEPFALGPETSFHDIRRVVSYRCVKCNRLYPYAQDFVLGETLWQSQKKGMMVGIFFGILLIVFAFVFSFAMGGFN
jgi:hypothetical protein